MLTLANKDTESIQWFEKPQFISKTVMDMRGVVTIILAGGKGTRLFPLTETRSKPAIAFGGRYKLIDIPISSALNSGCTKIFVLTQFLSSSLQQHIFRTYHRNPLSSRGFVEVLAPQEKKDGLETYLGTADAVRKNLDILQQTDAEYFLILSGDQLYRMDFQDMVRVAVTKEAELVVSALPVRQKEAKRMGLLKLNRSGYVEDFIEKPQDNNTLNSFSIGSDREGMPWFLGSMGIYLFKRQALIRLLQDDLREDFGKHLIPKKIQEGKVTCHLHSGYWEDVGTIESLYRANLALTNPKAPLDCYDESNPIYTQPYQLPGPKISNTRLKQSVLCEGSYIDADEITESLIGPRVRLKHGSIIRRSYLVGNDFYQPPFFHPTLPDYFCIEKDVIIERAIIDRHVHIGEGARLINREGHQRYDSPFVYIRDGIIIVPEGASVPPGFIL